MKTRANAGERQITLKHLYISNQQMIGLQFYPNKVIQALVKELPGVGWSNEFNMVIVPNAKNNLNLIFDKFKGVCWINCAHFFPNKPVNQGNEDVSVDSYRKRAPKPGWKYCPEEFYRKLEVRKYALSTAKSYISLFERFINYYKNVNLMDIHDLKIREYLQSLVLNNLSDSYLNQSINAIKFYYEVVKGMPNRFYSIERPIKKECLPKVLSMEQVFKMIEETSFLKHRCIVSLLYSAGLRRSELLNLKLEDIESDRMLIKVVQGKGKKDILCLVIHFWLN